jgi:hypothetical protein
MESFMHEIGQAVGLFHEHQRSDRDDFVRIFLRNVRPGREGNFDLMPGSLNSDRYDFRSLMHYSSTGASANGRATIQPRVAGAVLNGSTSFTADDKAFLDAMYPTRPVVRRSDSSIDPQHAGDVREIAVTRIEGTSDLVTAVVDESDDNRLLLIRSRVDDRGGIRRIHDTHDQSVGRASSVSIAAVGGRIVTAFRGSTKNLMLIAWDVSGDEIRPRPRTAASRRARRCRSRL